MKLYEFKAKYMSNLILYTPTSKIERELRDKLIKKLNYLRYNDLPNLVHHLYLIIEHENVSDGFKRLIREMIEDVAKISR